MHGEGLPIGWSGSVAMRKDSRHRICFLTEEQVGRRQLCLPNDGNIITNSKNVVKNSDINIFM